MTIGKKLYLGFGAIVAILVVLFITNTTVVMQEHAAGGRASESLSRVESLQAAQLAMMQIRLSLQDYLLTGYEHTGDMLVLYLPKEKILAEPDAFTPPAQAGTPLIPTALPYAKALNDNLKRLKLDVAVIAPLHGNRTTTTAELAQAAGASAAN